MPNGVRENAFRLRGLNTIFLLRPGEPFPNETVAVS
jgi:hypothetical protein